MPDILDILGFVLSIISFVGLHQLKELVARRLPPRRLQAIQTELAQLCQLLERIERIGHPDEQDVIRRLRRRLEELDARITHTWLDVDKWKAKGVVRRCEHWAERVELSRRCSALSRDIEELRAHLHLLPPPRPHILDHAPDAHAPTSEVSSCVPVNCEPSPAAFSVSSTVASSPETAPPLPDTPPPTLPTLTPPTSVEAAGPSGNRDHDDGHDRQPTASQELHKPTATQSWVPDGHDQHTSAVDPFKSGDNRKKSRVRRPRVALHETQHHVHSCNSVSKEEDNLSGGLTAEGLIRKMLTENGLVECKQSDIIYGKLDVCARATHGLPL
ncbi:uncharacterized protein TRAVEDRAFT_53907 [Trametes versicolor FP-101664 SS1]|uniref:Uncharacterized protein n=1 Tax=Trametes versicolor (strain FP-101664) TaxID=717944 RepID=R7S8C2_TRAVS|nr:uncharacterized protein TRAVEDRAFT_53907 [Trametes versicolor FP-101664 SS1]EIW51912.1 hypothetical protein TRAVEDRAFT_53907 [Trametes versicolor FP-101664 SS1]